MLTERRVVSVGLTRYEHDKENVFRTCSYSNMLYNLIFKLLGLCYQDATFIERLLNVFGCMCPCRYTVSGPTWIGPGGNVTCTLMEEGGRRKMAAITVTTVYRLMQGSRSQSCIRKRDDNGSLSLLPRGTG